MDAIADTRTLAERSVRLGRHIKNSPGQVLGSAVALHLDAPSGQPQWALAEIAEAPRHRERGGVIHGFVQRKSDKDNGMS